MIEADGTLHRFASSGKHGDDAGWYALHDDGIPAGSFGDWRSGFSQTWRADIGRKLTPAEDAAHRAKVEAMRRERDAAIARERAAAVDKAVAIWNAAKPAPVDHAYLTRKTIKPSGARLHGDALVIPMRDGGDIHSLQFIGPDGGKRFLTGGRVTGCYFTIGNPNGAAALCIAEGFATGATIHEATGYPVAVAFNAGNLGAVAKTLRGRFPDLPLILCGDFDKSGSGQKAATEAAQAVGGRAALPDFTPDELAGEKPPSDFNDLAQLRGADAVGQAIAEASAPGRATHLADPAKAPAGEYASCVELLRGSDVKPEAVTWLWPGWLAAGKMHVLGGAPGTGKTTISMALAATVTTGGRWPDGSRSPVGNVVIWSGEDDPADTLVPRLALSGADMTRVYFIADVFDGDGRRSFDPARDMEPLRRELTEIGDVRLLIVDPIVSAVIGDSHKNAEVRRSLQPLVDLAAFMRCALLGITHFSKGTGGRDPVERLTGSLAFGALARVVMVAAKHQEEGEDGRTVRLFIRAKSNIGPDDGGFEYDLHQGELKAYPGIFASSVLWGDAVEGAARELLATADATSDDGEGGTQADARRFLSDLLADGSMPVKSIRADADGAGYSWATIRRAQKALGIEAVKEGGHFGNGKQQWVWKLLVTEGAQAEHLQTDSLKALKNVEDAQQKELSTFRLIR
ncbi:MAG: AAA family ATPase [Sulfuritalea sp.]|nr:AAA family ATPase [Sulfuritalea sp.]